MKYAPAQPNKPNKKIRHNQTGTGAALRCSPVNTFLPDERLWSSEPRSRIKAFALGFDPRGNQWFQKNRTPALTLTLALPLPLHLVTTEHSTLALALTLALTLTLTLNQRLALYTQFQW